ncbi:ABC-2 family transporter protein [Streptomyces sp. NPDC004752]
MTRLARLLRLHVVRQVLSWSGSWWFVFALAAGQVLPPLVGLAVWRSVFPDSTHVSTYYVALIFVVATTASYENHTFSQAIYRGTLADELVKPQPVVLAPFGENIAIRVWISIFAVPAALLMATVTKVTFNFTDLLMALPSWLGAGFLRFLFTWCLAMTAFWTERVHAITGFATTFAFLLGGNAVPIDLLPSGWDVIARFLPFYSMVGLPADTTAGLSTGTAAAGVAVQGMWLVLLGVLAVTLWRRGLMRYTAAGG